MNNTYHQSSSQNNLMLHQTLSEDGLKKVKSDVCDQTKKEEESTIFKMLKKYLVSCPTTFYVIKKQFVMQELVQLIKKKICNDKLNCFQQSAQMQQLSKTLVLDSIGKDQDLIPFWNKYTMEMSKQLWLPTKTDCVDLDLKLSTGSLRKTMSSSWFSVREVIKKTSLENYQKTYLQSLQYLLPEITDCEQGVTKEKESKKESKKLIKQSKETDDQKTKRLAREEKKKNGKEEAGSSIKYNIHFSKEQRITLRKWFGVRRWIYNKCIIAYKSGITTLSGLRDAVIKNKNFETQNVWMLDYHFDLRDEALQDFLKNIKSNFAKENHHFDIKFKTRKDMSTKNESLSVLSKHWNKPRNFYTSIFSPNNMKCSEPLPEVLHYTSRLLRTPLGKYYLCVPKPIKKNNSENQTDVVSGSMVFIDPGVKTFLTGYDPSGKVYHIGEGDVGRIGRMLHYKNKLKSKLSRERNKKRKRSMRNAMLRMNLKIKNLVKDLHRKAAKWLCQNYENIYLPRLNFHTCKRLNRRSKEKMATFSHCSFSDLVRDKAREYSTCNVYEVNESYTSKTCSSCGYQNEYLSNKDVFFCEECGTIIGRDTNASRNVMLRYFSKRVALKSNIEV